MVTEIDTFPVTNTFLSFERQYGGGGQIGIGQFKIYPAYKFQAAVELKTKVSLSLWMDG